jgi:hypothetical protein
MSVVLSNNPLTTETIFLTLTNIFKPLNNKSNLNFV